MVKLVPILILLVADFVKGLVGKSTPLMLAPFVRLWKETLLVRGILHNDDYAQWKPESARYIALRAIKAKGLDKETSQPALDLLCSFLENKKPVVLLGEPGAGKTTALQALTYRLAIPTYRKDKIWIGILLIVTGIVVAAMFLLRVHPILSLLWPMSFILSEPLTRRGPVPLFLEARSEYEGNEVVRDWCEKVLKKHLGEKPLLGPRNVVFFIDGVNEMQAYENFVNGWSAILKQAKPPRVILTSRVGVDPAPSLGLENRALTVCDLDDRAVKEFLRVYGRERTVGEYPDVRMERDFSELQDKNLLAEKGIGRNPYWLKMIVESTLYTPNRGMLLQSFAEKVISREITKRAKPKLETVPLNIEMSALANLALAMHKEQRVGFIGEAGWKTARDAVGNKIDGLNYSAEDVFNEAEGATLVRWQFDTKVEFVHQLVQEFFSAYALRDEGLWQNAIAHTEDVWWWQTLFLLGGLTSIPGSGGSIDKWIKFTSQILGDGKNDERLFVAVGLLRSIENPDAATSRQVLEAFYDSVSDTLTQRQMGAVRELERILGDEVIKAFEAMLCDSDLRIRTKGVVLLCASGSDRASEVLLNALRNELLPFDLLIQLGPRAIEVLIRAMRDQNVALRQKVAEALGQINDKRAVEPLIVALGDARTVRRSAAESLVKIGDDAVQRLIATLSSGNKAGRRSVVEVLGQIGDASAVEPLIDALADSDVAVRQKAVEALGRIGDTRAVEPLIALLRDKDLDWRPAKALGQIGDERAIEPLRAALRDKFAPKQAAKAIGKIREQLRSRTHP